MKKQLTIICIIGMLLAVGLSGCLENNKGSNGNIAPSSRNVTVTTNKCEYLQNETINITVYNGLNVSIFSYIAGIPNVFFIESIERKTIDGWQSFLTYCPDVHFLYELVFPGEIKSGDYASFEWEPLFWINGTYNFSQLEPGVYRIKTGYNLSGNNTWQSIYSNEFTIKEENTSHETFTVYREAQEQPEDITVYNVSIPLDESEAITVFETITGEKWSGLEEKGYMIKSITKTETGWNVYYGNPVYGFGYIINEQNRTINIYGGY